MFIVTGKKCHLDVGCFLISYLPSSAPLTPWVFLCSLHHQLLLTLLHSPSSISHLSFCGLVSFLSFTFLILFTSSSTYTKVFLLLAPTSSSPYSTILLAPLLSLFPYWITFLSCFFPQCLPYCHLGNLVIQVIHSLWCPCDQVTHLKIQGNVCGIFSAAYLKGINHMD